MLRIALVIEELLECIAEEQFWKSRCANRMEVGHKVIQKRGPTILVGPLFYS